MTATTDARHVAQALRSLADAMTGTQDIARQATDQLRDLANLIDQEDIDDQLTGNPDPDTHDGIDYWPYGDAVRWFGDETP